MTDADPKDDDVMRAGEYALGLLSSAEAEAFEREMAARPALRAAYVSWAEEFAGLTEELRPENPPQHVKRKIEAELFGEAPPRRLGWLWGWGAGLAAALVLLALVFGTDLMRGGGGSPLYVAEIAAEDASLVIAASYGSDGAFRVERRAGGARPGRALELWLIAGGNAPVSLGVLPEAREAELRIPPELRDSLAGGVLAVSDEPDGGSPTGAPTGDVLAVGEVRGA